MQWNKIVGAWLDKIKPNRKWGLQSSTQQRGYPAQWQQHVTRGPIKPVAREPARPMQSAASAHVTSTRGAATVVTERAATRGAAPGRSAHL
eukprot:1498077-Amphidinium_carterae.1